MPLEVLTHICKIYIALLSARTLKLYISSFYKNVSRYQFRQLVFFFEYHWELLMLTIDEALSAHLNDRAEYSIVFKEKDLKITTK